MYLYQLILARDWQQFEDNHQLFNQQLGCYSYKLKRIKYFYDHEYGDIVKQLVNEPESCKNFYAVLQEVGLPYQTYYHKSADIVAKVLTNALYKEHVILIHQQQINSYNDNSSLFGNEYRSIPVIKKESYYESDDSWLIVNLQNHHSEQIQILDASSNQLVTNAQTSTKEIFLKHGDAFSSNQVLPKVHILLGGLQGNYDLTLRGDKSLRVKSLAQNWLDELSKLLRSGNSPFTIEQDEALASLINYSFSSEHYNQTKKIDDKSAFRPDETIGVFFYQMLVLLHKTDFITAKQRIGDCSADESEGALPDIKLIKQALKALHNIRHSEGQDQTDYAYHNNKLTLTANGYLNKPLVLDGTGHENDYESLLKKEVKYYTQLDQLSEIESLYFKAIKLLKQLREPGLIRHVETRREYQLKVTKLKYSYVELKSLDYIQLELHSNYRYEIISDNNAYRFIGRFNSNGKVNVKIPAKWSATEYWHLNAEPVEEDFVAKLFPKLVNPTFTKQDINNTLIGINTGGIMGGVTGYLYGDQIKETMIENLPRITGALQVAGGVASLYVAGVVSATGIGAPLAAVIGFVALDNIQAGMQSMYTNQYKTTYGGELIEWSGLLPKGYGEIAYSLVDIGLVGKASALLKTVSQTTNIIKFKPINTVKEGKALKPTEVTISIEKIHLNQENKIELKELTFNPHGSLGSAKPWTIAQRLKYAKLPTTGKIRFVPPDGYTPNVPLLKGKNHGYIDKFENEWVKGPSRTAGQEFEWDVQLSELGSKQLGWASRDGKHINVSLDGKITHK